MAGSFTAQEIARALINGNLTGAELETLVTSGTMAATYLGACRDLFTSGTMNAILNSQVGFTSLVGSATLLPYLLNSRGADIAASDNATACITTVPAAMAAIVDSTTFLDFWISVAENRTRLSNRVNASGSVLVRQQFTENGTYTVPEGGLLRLSYFVIGPGGNGGSSFDGRFYNGTGGSGGGASFGTVSPGSIPAAGENIIITVPTSAGSNATIGAFATGASGNNGISNTSSAPNVPGGGSTSGSSCYDTAVTTAVYQPNTGTRMGGMGGGVINVSTGSNGTAGLTGSGGIAGGTNGGGAGGGTAGTGYGSGGGAGQGNPSSSFKDGQSAAATDYGSGGGGASGAGVIDGTGGTGAGGLAIIYGVKAVA